MHSLRHLNQIRIPVTGNYRGGGRGDDVCLQIHVGALCFFLQNDAYLFLQLRDYFIAGRAQVNGEPGVRRFRVDHFRTSQHANIQI